MLTMDVKNLELVCHALRETAQGKLRPADPQHAAAQEEATVGEKGPWAKFPWYKKRSVERLE